MKYLYKIILLIFIMLNFNLLIYCITLTDDDLSSFSKNDPDTYPPVIKDSETTSSQNDTDNNPRKFLKNKFETIKSSLPSENLVLEIKIPGFYITSEKPFQDKTGIKTIASNPMNKVEIVIILEKTTKDGDYMDCRDYFYDKVIQKSIVEKKDMKKYEAEDSAFIEYIIPKTDAQNINQKNLFIFMTKEDVWIIIQVYKNDYNLDEDENNFTQVKDNIRILNINSDEIEAEAKKEKAAALLESNEALKNYVEGMTLYEKAEYAKASVYLQKALDLEKDNPTFTQDKIKWRKLVVKLTYAYGIPVVTEKCKETLTPAIEIDPDYSLFYYIYACMTAAQYNLEETMNYLEKAYICELKNNTDYLPNPYSQMEFQSYLQDDRFIELLDKYLKK